MSATVADRPAAAPPPTPAPAPAEPPPRAAVLALAVREGRLLLRSPTVLGGAVLSVLLLVLPALDEAPVLHRDDARIAMGLLPLAGATMLAAHLAVLRGRRHDTEELYATLPTRALARTAAHLLALAAPAGLAALLVLAHVVWLLARGGVGSPSPAELVTGPVLVALAGAVGVALARWAPWTAAGPLGLVVLGVWQLVAWDPGESTAGTVHRWLGLWVEHRPQGGLPPALLIRPSGWHLAWLLVLGAAVAVLAASRHGWTPRRAGALAATVALTVGLGAGQLAAARAAVTVAPDPVAWTAAQDCERRDGVTYCAFDAYRPWIDDWAAAVQGVRTALPDDVADATRGEAGPVVRQVPDAVAWAALSVEDPFSHIGSEPADPDPDAAARVAGPGTVRTGMRWSAGDRTGVAAFVLARAYAREVVGLPGAYTVSERRMSEGEATMYAEAGGEEAAPEAGDIITEVGSCVPAGQARGVVVLWLAARSTPAAERAFRDELSVSERQMRALAASSEEGVVLDIGFHAGWEYEAGNSSPVEWTFQDAVAAGRLLDLPDERVARVLAGDWDRWTDPSTSSGELLAALGLDGGVPPGELDPWSTACP